MHKQISIAIQKDFELIELFKICSEKLVFSRVQSSLKLRLHYSKSSDSRLVNKIKHAFAVETNKSSHSYA